MDSQAAELLNNINRRIAKGAAWMMLLKLVERSIGLVSVLILARLLTPADFGVVAMAMSVVALTELMGAFGFDTALIQRQNAQRHHYDTAWTFNVLFGTAIALLLLILSIPAANFYREPRLSWILPALAVAALAGGFENIGTVNFRKEMNFWQEFRFLFLKKVLSFTITIGLALWFRSYWALVAGIVTGRLFSLLMSYRLHPYRPQFSLSASEDLFHFSKWLFVSNLVLFLQNKSADFILGRTIGAHGLGVYNVAFEIAVLPSTELIAPLNRAVFPAYSKLSGNLPELRRNFLKVFSIVALIAFPVSTGLACIAAPAVLVILGSKWVEAIPLLRIFTIAGLLGALQSNLHLVIIALGKPKANTLVSAVTLITSLPIFIAATFYYGPIGAAWTYLLFGFIGLCTIHVVFIHITEMPIKPYLSTMVRPIISSIVMAIVVSAADAFIDQFEDVRTIFKLVNLVLVGACTYMITILVTWAFSGRPQGGETIILELLFKKLGRFKSI